MAPRLNPNPNLLIAVDSNVPLDLAEPDDEVIDAIETIRARVPMARIVVPPSVFQELVLFGILDFGILSDFAIRISDLRLGLWTAASSI